MKLTASFIVGMTMISMSSISIAAGDVAKGKAKSAVCSTCHGAEGIAIMPTYPNLAGQNAEYLESALKAYRDKQRQGGMAGIMQMQAANLSDDDIANLAAYYSSLK
ncbi:c-type cytochrome [Methylophaga pinxianii]|uniref:c-type cytochrome n=1 Tax=Methylophaga pinxianii TaxID=2881052 RepID=UPI001CF458E8|nr:cytochrome c [Methylophaga pinxianii]MCB2427090.1 cytochrome c [Methylophaga pinxianii]UPH46012.1 cytochrome c [Methylophaga pinxianii]